MNIEHRDTFWKIFWIVVGSAIVLCAGVALLLLHTRPPLSLETPPALAPDGTVPMN